MNEQAREPCFDFLSDEELQELLDMLKRDRSSTVQVLGMIRRLLQSEVDTSLVLRAIPEVLTCSSSDFEVLCPYFTDLIARNPLRTSDLLNILHNFDCEPHMRGQAYQLSMRIFENIEAEHIPELLRYVLLILPTSNVTEFYWKLKDILTVHNDLPMYKALEDGIKPHLMRFFHCLTKVKKWQFYDFFIVLLCLTRPSLRAKVPSVIWPALFNGSLVLSKMTRYVSKSRILSSKFPSLIRFVDILMASVPKSMIHTTFYPMTTLCGNIICCYPDMVNSFIDQLVAYVTGGPNFASSVAISVMLRMDKTPLSSRTIHLDEIISQSTSLHPASLHAICQIIAVSTPIEHRPMLLVSIPKRLFHHSQVLIQAGISISVQLVVDGAEESLDILSSVLKAISVNWLVVKPSVLLSVVDLMWIVNDESIRQSMLLFCLKVIDYYCLIVSIDTKVVTVGAERDHYAVSCSKLLDDEQSEFCGEIVSLVSYLLCSMKKKSIPKQFKNEAKYLEDLSNLSFVVPKEFVDLSVEPKSDGKISGSQVQFLLGLRAFLFPLISHSETNFEQVLFLIQVVSAIDDFLTSVQLASKVSLPDLDSVSVLHPHFIFSALTEQTFDFPDDLVLISLMLRSLRLVFLDVSHTRHFFSEPIDFLDSHMNQSLIQRILSIVKSILKLSRQCRQRNEMKLLKRCVRAACDALDFITFCSTLKQVEISFENNVCRSFKYSDDVGVACRLLTLGIHLKNDMSVISDIAISCLRTYLVCNLCDYPILYPYGLRDMESIVKPYQPGANWRLIIYFAFMYSTVDQFVDTFGFLIEEIKEDRIEVQMALILVDIIAVRLHELSSAFDACVSFATELVELVVDSDVTVLIPLSKLIHTINVVKSDVPHSPENVNELAQLMNRAFRRFGNLQSRPRLQMVFASLKGECDLLREDTETPVPEPEPVRVENPFDVEPSSSYEFELETDNDSAEEEEEVNTA